MKEKTNRSLHISLRRNKIIDELWYVSLPKGMSLVDAKEKLKADPLVFHEWSSFLEETEAIDTVGTTLMYVEEV